MHKIATYESDMADLKVNKIIKFSGPALGMAVGAAIAWNDYCKKKKEYDIALESDEGPREYLAKKIKPNNGYVTALAPAAIGALTGLYLDKKYKHPSPTYAKLFGMAGLLAGGNANTNISNKNAEIRRKLETSDRNVNRYMKAQKPSLLSSLPKPMMMMAAAGIPLGLMAMYGKNFSRTVARRNAASNSFGLPNGLIVNPNFGTLFPDAPRGNGVDYDKIKINR